MLPPAGDEGQRYEVRFIDGDGMERTFGWCAGDPQRMVAAIEAHPVWHSPRVIDRSLSP